tara:strand:+ start:279 stop:485 length:207 start_codon:yes stop_codon:yes gene_type:complete
MIDYLITIVVMESFTFINKETGESITEVVPVERPMCITKDEVHYVKQGGVGAYFCKATPALIALAKGK